MKQLALILISAALLFMILSIFQEWATFQPLFSAAPKSLSQPTCAKEARQALETFCALLPHVYKSGGDIRFLDRLPASDSIKQEITLDLQYLARNQRYQQMNLHRQTISSEKSLASDACSIETREYWIVRYLDIHGRALEEKPMALVTSWRYVIQKTAAGWELISMEPTN